MKGDIPSFHMRYGRLSSIHRLQRYGLWNSLSWSCLVVAGLVDDDKLEIECTLFKKYLQNFDYFSLEWFFLKTSAKTEPLGKAGTILNAQSKVGRQLQYVTIGHHSLKVKIRLNVQFFSRYHSQIISLIVSSALCMPNVKPWHGHMEIRQRVHSGD